MDDTQYIIKSMKYKRNLLSTENNENVPDDDDDDEDDDDDGGGDDCFCAVINNCDDDDDDDDYGQRWGWWMMKTKIKNSYDSKEMICEAACFILVASLLIGRLWWHHTEVRLGEVQFTFTHFHTSQF